ncbi:MAG: hypothetical protein IKE43_10890 [Coriobacteriales bacterium]|nr:hypothetical protein [Coriobacteriales bacterium]
MASVTQRIKEIKQPRGGYLNLKMFTKTVLGPGEEELKQTDFQSGLTGLAVDYLTRFMLGTPVKTAFRISILGAERLSWDNNINTADTVSLLLKNIKGLDDNSIISACKMCGYDTCLRAGIGTYKPIEEIEPDDGAIENIRIMVNRSLAFFEQYGPVTCVCPVFHGGYAKLVDSGDGDYLTKDTIWDMKVSKKPPKSSDRLQILMYYILGKHSFRIEFDTVYKIGIYNARLNTVYLLDVNDIDRAVIHEVEYDVIGYQTCTHHNTEIVTRNTAADEYIYEQYVNHIKEQLKYRNNTQSEDLSNDQPNDGQIVSKPTKSIFRSILDFFAKAFHLTKL